MGTTQPIRKKQQLEHFRNYYKKEENKPRNYALIVFGLNSALRISDILDLKWKDVCNSVGYLDHIIVMEKKTGKKNVLALNRATKEALNYYRKTLDTIVPEHYIFSSQKMNQLHGLKRFELFKRRRRNPA